MPTVGFTPRWRRPSPADRDTLADYLRCDYPGGRQLLDAGVLDTPHRAALVSIDHRRRDEHPLFAVAFDAGEIAWLDDRFEAGLFRAPRFVVELLVFAADPDVHDVHGPLAVTSRDGAELLAVMLAGISQHYDVSSLDLVTDRLVRDADPDRLAAAPHGQLVAGTFAELAASGYGAGERDVGQALLAGTFAVVGSDDR